MSDQAVTTPAPETPPLAAPVATPATPATPAPAPPPTPDETFKNAQDELQSILASIDRTLGPAVKERVLNNAKSGDYRTDQPALTADPNDEEIITVGHFKKMLPTIVDSIVAPIRNESTQAQVLHEQQRADAVIYGMGNKFGFTNDEINAVVDDVINVYEFDYTKPKGSAKIARAVLQQLNMMAYQKRIAPSTVPAAPGAQPAPVPISPERQKQLDAIERMKSVGPSTGGESVFG